MKLRSPIFCLLLGLLPIESTATDHIYVISGDFNSGSLSGAHFEWRVTVDRDKGPNLVDFPLDKDFAYSVYLPDKIEVQISGSRSYDGTYSVNDPSLGQITFYDYYYESDSFQINTGGISNLDIPGFGSFGANFFFTLNRDDVIQEVSPGLHPVVEINSGDIASQSFQFFPSTSSQNNLLRTQSVSGIGISMDEQGRIILSFEKVLQSSSDLSDWQDVSPQPSSPYRIQPAQSGRMFFRFREY